MAQIPVLIVDKLEIRERKKVTQKFGDLYENQ